MKTKYMGSSVVCFAALLLAACGGGGGGGGSSGPVTSTDSFPVAQAVAAITAAGWNKNFTATQAGTVACNGTGNLTRAPATTSTTFYVTPSNPVSAVSAVETLTWNWTNCTPASNAVTATLYYTPTTYVPLGINSVGVNYGAYLTPATYPATVTVGATGIIGTESLFTDSTETTSNGRIDGSYVVTADTASTAIITLIGKNYNASSTLTATEQDAWRITATGALTPINTVIQYTSGATVTWTYN